MSDGPFAMLVRRAAADPAFRGTLIWFPEKVISEYGLVDDEANAVRTHDITSLRLSEEIGEIAAEVFDLHDMHSGE